MANINLLPWRESRREVRKQQFFIALGGSIFVVLIVMLFVHLTVAGWVNKQEARNTFLNNEITTLNTKIREIRELKKQKTALLARMNIIQELQANRPRIVHLIDEIINILPVGVHLMSLSQVGEGLIMEGKAESNTNVSDLMRNVESSAWMMNPMLSEIKTDKNNGQRISDFRLQVSQKDSGSHIFVKGDL